MSLKIRIIPTLLWDGISLVKGSKFNNQRRVGSIMPAVKVYNQRMVDELIVVDINATKENRRPDFEWVEEFSSECFVPLTVGGGVRTVDDIQNLLLAGADKVCINSAAFENLDLISLAANKFGSQCIVVSIDAYKKANGEFSCCKNSGSVYLDKKVELWAHELESAGAGEILITSVDRDGTMTGYEIELIKIVTSSVQIPVIASGGAGNYNRMYDAINEGGAVAVSAASIFHFTQQTPLEAKKFLFGKEIAVRF